MLNAAENHSSFSAPVEEKAHHERLDEAKIELQDITNMFQLMVGDGEESLQSAIQWMLPKLESVSDAMDKLSCALLKEQESGTQGGAA